MRSLSKRECQVLALAARGYGNTDIGGILRISENTVKCHVHNALDALGCDNRTQAVVRWLTGAEVGYRVEVVR